jgi:MFS superfamily sulfate permease-like transporter
VLTLLFLSSLIAMLPQAALGAPILVSAAGMVSVNDIKAMPSAPGQSAAASDRSGQASGGSPGGTAPTV